MERARRRAGRDKRDQLVDAAQRLAIKRGLVAPRLKDISEESGISPALVLYYYPEMPDLMAEMLQRVTMEFCERRSEVVFSYAHPATRLAAMISLGCLYPGHREDNGRTVAVLLHVAIYDPQMSELYARFFEGELAIFEQILQEGVADGSFTLRQDPREAAQSCLGLEDLLGFLTLAGIREPSDVEASLRRHAESIVGVELPPSPIPATD